MQPTSCIFMKLKLSFVCLAVLCLLATGVKAEFYPMNSRLALTEKDHQTLIQYCRLFALNKNDQLKTFPFPDKLAKIKNDIILAIFHGDGRLLDTWRVEGEGKGLKEKLDQGLYDLYTEIPKKWPDYKRKVSLGTRMQKLRSRFKEKKDYVHLFIVEDQRSVPNYSISNIFESGWYQPHVSGLRFKLGDEEAEVTPFESVYLNMGAKGARSMLLRILKKEAKDLARLTDLQIQVYRGVHIGESFPLREPMAFFRGQQIFTVHQLNQTQTQKRLQFLMEWYQKNTTGGQITDVYKPASQKVDNENQSVMDLARGVWALSELAHRSQNETFKKIAQEAINDFASRYFNITESLKLGTLKPLETPLKNGDRVFQNYPAAGFLAMSMVRTDPKAYQPQIDLLVNWLTEFQSKTGTLKGVTIKNQSLYLGQVLWAAVNLVSHNQNAKLESFVKKAISFQQNRWQNLLDWGDSKFVPDDLMWGVLALQKAQQDFPKLVEKSIILKWSDRIVGWSHPSLYYDGQGQLTQESGRGRVYKVAKSLVILKAAQGILPKGDTRYEFYQKKIDQATAYLFRLQFIPENTYYLRDREKALGAFKFDKVNSKISLKTQNAVVHALLALTP